MHPIFQVIHWSLAQGQKSQHTTQNRRLSALCMIWFWIWILQLVLHWWCSALPHSFISKYWSVQSLHHNHNSSNSDVLDEQCPAILHAPMFDIHVNKISHKIHVNKGVYQDNKHKDLPLYKFSTNMPPSKEGICDTHTCPLSMQEFDKNLKFQAGQKSAEKRKEYTTKNATEFWAKSENITCLKEEKKHSMCLLHCSRLLQPMLLETWDSSCPSLNLLPYFPLWNQILNVYLKTHFALAPKFNPDLTTSQFKI